MSSYPFGSAVTVEATFIDSASRLPSDPTTITLRILNPAGNKTVLTMPQLTHVSTGVWSYVIAGVKPGTWYYRFEGTGACNACQDGNFAVASSDFADAA